MSLGLAERLSAARKGCEELPEKDALRPWLVRMLQAASDSRACGLVSQAERLADRIEAVLERARTRLAVELERQSLKVEIEWEPPQRDVAGLRRELSAAIRSGRYALPPVEVPLVLERVAILGGDELLTLRGSLNGRRLRFLRSRRRPWNKPRQVSEEQTVGLYNRQGVTGDVLEMAARQAPLWVDDLLELERHFAAIDGMLAQK